MTETHPTWNVDPATPLSTKVVKTVATATNTDPTALPPLHDTVNTDVLDTIFASRTNGQARTNGKLVFHYAGLEITVRADKSVDVEHPATTEE